MNPPPDHQHNQHSIQQFRQPVTNHSLSHKQSPTCNPLIPTDGDTPSHTIHRRHRQPQAGTDPAQLTAHQNAATAQEAPRPIRNRWDRALAQHPAPQRLQPTAHTDSAPHTQPQQGGTLPTQQPPAPTEPTHTWEQPPWEQPATTNVATDMWGPPPWEANSDANAAAWPQPTTHTAPAAQTDDQHHASSSHEQPPRVQETAEPAKAATSGGTSNTQNPSSATAAGPGGYHQIKSWRTLRPRGGRGGDQTNPTTKGGVIKRMRGKRFKAAIQTAFAQRGWDKREDQTWKQVAHLVDLYEDDEEEVWAKVLAAGPRRPRQRQPPTAPQSRGGGQGQGEVNWGLLLNLHNMPRGTVGPAQAATQAPQQQQPETPRASNQKDSGSGGTPRGTPGGAEKQAGSTQAPATTRQKTPHCGTASIHMMLISHGGAPPAPHIPTGALRRKGG